jgi:UDP-N-acetylmuramoyl-tripeptide--D-alanyl-D-alanine ligase
MLELGDLSRVMHAQAINDILATRPDIAVVVGAQMSAAAQESAFGPSNLQTVSTSDEAARHIPELVRPGDVVLVKASRGIAMERIVEALGA